MAELTVVRLVVVDDDPLVRAGLLMILGGAADLDVVGEAADGRDAVRERPDVVLMDIRMPRIDGLAATRQLRDRGSQARVIVLTTFDTDELVVTALREGAAGFLVRTPGPQTSLPRCAESRSASRCSRRASPAASSTWSPDRATTPGNAPPAPCSPG